MDYCELERIMEIIETNVENNVTFDFIRTTKLESDESAFNNMLFFLSYSMESEVQNEWCNHFDLRERANQLFRGISNATFVIEEEQKEYLLDDTKYIVVDSVRDSIDSLFKHKMKSTKAKTIGVTGSVGKTTCAGLIESALKSRYKVLRIYSSRITPLLLKGKLLNYLSDDTDYVVMEYAIYAKSHVEELVDILPPSIAVMLNVTNEHLGKPGLKSRDDIIEGKMKIFKYAELGLTPIELCGLSSSAKEIRALSTSNVIKNGDSYSYKNVQLSTFPNTSLSIQQYVSAIEIALYLGLDSNEIQKSISKYSPVESRFRKLHIWGKPVIFLGETIHNSRLSFLADELAEKKSLIIRKIGARSTYTDCDSLVESIDKFHKVYFFDDIGDDYVQVLSSLSNTEIVSDHSFMERVVGDIVYIYSGYHHSFSKTDVGNFTHYDTTYRVKGLGQ